MIILITCLTKISSFIFYSLILFLSCLSNNQVNNKTTTDLDLFKYLKSDINKSKIIFTFYCKACQFDQLI